jgi:glycosyltransferase involved in cell wall biosynthesis
MISSARPIHPYLVLDWRRKKMRCPTLAELPEPPTDKSGWPWTEESRQLPDLMPNQKPWPKVSVVTPVYNQESFIEETIRSVLLQGYPDYEHIIINDGSTDGSLAVVAKYSPWVTCITQRNAGQSAALNRGFRMAQGELIGWQNSDDFYGPDNFKEGVIASVQFPDFEIYNGTTKGFQEMEFRPPWLFEVSEEFSQAGLLERMCVMNQSMFFRRRIFEQGVFIKEEMHYAMDPDFFWRLSLEGFRYKLAPSMIGYYRQQAAAKSTNYSLRGDLEAYGILRWLCRDKRLAPELRRAARSKLRTNFLRSFTKARRSVPKKFAPELLLPI